MQALNTTLAGLNAANTLRQSGFTDSAAMALRYLEFDQSEDALGMVAWDALASPVPAHNAALLSEVSRLLDHLHAQHGPPGPLDEGHTWDCDLQVRQEDGAPLDWHWHAQHVHWPSQAAARLTLSLCLTGGPAFVHTLEQEVTPT